MSEEKKTLTARDLWTFVRINGEIFDPDTGEKHIILDCSGVPASTSKMKNVRRGYAIGFVAGLADNLHGRWIKLRDLKRVCNTMFYVDADPLSHQVIKGVKIKKLRIGNERRRSYHLCVDADLVTFMRSYRFMSANDNNTTEAKAQRALERMEKGLKPIGRPRKTPRSDVPSIVGPRVAEKPIGHPRKILPDPVKPPTAAEIALTKTVAEFLDHINERLRTHDDAFAQKVSKMVEEAKQDAASTARKAIDEAMPRKDRGDPAKALTNVLLGAAVFGLWAVVIYAMTNGIG